MAEGKTSFVLYTDQKEIFETISDEQAGKLIKHIFKYVTDENPTTDDDLVRALFIGIKQTLKRDLKRWETKQAQRIRAGQESARKRKEAAKLARQKNKNPTTVNDRLHPSTVSGSVSVSVSDSVSGILPSKEGANKNARAIDFLKLNYPTRFETQFEMRHLDKINNPEKFFSNFNNKVDTESLEFTDRILFARLDTFAGNWIENQNRYNSQQNVSETYHIPASE